jgi:hypothetical protein
MGVDGEFLVVSVVDADGQDLSGVLGALGAGDVLNVGVGGGSGDLGPLTARVDTIETGLGEARTHLQAFSEAMAADRLDHLAWRKTATEAIDAAEQAVADVAGDLAGLPLDGLADVTAPGDTPAGKVLGTTAEGSWAPVDPPSGGGVPDWWKTQVEQFLTVPGQWDQPYPDWDAAVDYPRSAVVIRGQVPYLANGDPTVGVGPPAAPWVPMSVLRETVGRTLDGLHDVTAPPSTPAGKVLGTTATGQWGPVDPPAAEPVPQALDDLTDVDVSLAATGMMLTKQLDGNWKGANFTRPLNWLTDVVAPPDAQGVLGTTAPGVWEPLPLDHLQQQIVGPLPGQVAALDQRIAALEVTPEPAPVDHALTVDNYSGGFTRIIGAQVIGTDPVRITVSLATTPGVNGTVFADLSAISGSANVWADFAGTLGRVEDALTGTPIHGAALKEVIRRGTVVICHRDNTDPAHPTLKVDGTEAAGQAGTSLTLASLADVDNAAATAPAGKVLGTTGVGEWAPVDPPSGGGDPRLTEVVASSYRSADLPPAWTTGQTWLIGSVAAHDGRLWRRWDAGFPALVPGEKQFQYWAPFDLERLHELVTMMTGYDVPPLEWDAAAAAWYPGQVATYNGHLWRAAARPTAGAGHEPGVDPAWERFDLGTAMAPPAGVWKSWTGSQSAYDALPTKDPAVLYIITG